MKKTGSDDSKEIGISRLFCLRFPANLSRAVDRVTAATLGFLNDLFYLDNLTLDFLASPRTLHILAVSAWFQM